MSTTNPRRLVYVSIDELTPADRNARLHDLPDLQAKMARFGFLDPIVIDERTGKIVGGHGRMETLQQARAAGLEAPEGIKVTKAGWFVPTMQGWASKSDREAEAANIALNPSPNDPGFDQELLAEILGSLAKSNELEGTGHDAASLEALLEELNGPPPLPDDTAHEPAPDVVLISEPGDVWELGPHRLIVGDATDPDVYARLMKGTDPTKIMLTDPPYGVELDHRWREGVESNRQFGHARRPIENDDRSDWREVYAMTDASIAYVWHAAKFAHIVLDGLEDAGFEMRQQIIWRKDQASMGRSAYHWQHETCWYLVRKGATATWQAGRDQTTVWDAASPIHAFGQSEDDKTLHPTQKPIAIYQRPLLNHTVKGEVMFDPFCGSGTSLIACEHNGRVARVLEKDPEWADVICRRYQALTGQKPKRGRKTVDFS